MRIDSWPFMAVLLLMLMGCNNGNSSSNQANSTTTDSTETTEEETPPLKENLVCECQMSKEYETFYHFYNCDELARSYTLIPREKDGYTEADYANRMFSGYDEFLKIAWELDVSGEVTAYYDRAQTQKAWQMHFLNGSQDGTLEVYDIEGNLRIKRTYSDYTMVSNEPDLGVINWTYDRETGEITVPNGVEGNVCHLLASHGFNGFDVLEPISETSNPISINGQLWTGKIWLYNHIDGFYPLPAFQLNYIDGIQQDTNVAYDYAGELYWMRVMKDGRVKQKIEFGEDNEASRKKLEKFNHWAVPAPDHKNVPPITTINNLENHLRNHHTDWCKALKAQAADFSLSNFKLWDPGTYGGWPAYGNAKASPGFETRYPLGEWSPDQTFLFQMDMNVSLQENGEKTSVSNSQLDELVRCYITTFPDSIQYQIDAFGPAFTPEDCSWVGPNTLMILGMTNEGENEEWPVVRVYSLDQETVRSYQYTPVAEERFDWNKGFVHPVYR